jgi:hypothetical protein
MKKLINIIIVLAALMVAGTSLANDEDEEVSYRGQMLKRMRANKLRQRTRAVLLETYYGEKIDANQVEGRSSDGSINAALRKRNVRLNNGRVFRSEEIEYVYSNDSARKPHERVRGNVNRMPEDDSE